MDLNFPILMVALFVFDTCASLHYLENKHPIGASRLTRTARNVKIPTYLSPNEVILHRGQTQHIRCPSYFKGERVSLVFWFKGEQLLARYTHPKVGSCYASSDRYRMSPSHDLIIGNVDMKDQGEYVCSVVPSATGLQRRQSISVTVLTDVPSFKEAMYRKAGDACVQRNQTHHIQCPSYREGESVSLVFWFKGSQLIARFANPAVGTNFISSRHYWMSSSHGLVINQVEATDCGDYVCGVVPTATGLQRKGSVRVTVLDPEFPIVDDALVVNKTSLILERGQGHVELTCPALPMDQQAATVYWSLGNGETMDASIIGVKFADGETMVSDTYRGDYIVNDVGSLVLNTLGMSTRRVWCHVFMDQPGLSSAYYDVIETVFGSTMESATSRNHSDEITSQQSGSVRGKAPYASKALTPEKRPDGSALLYIVPVVCPLTVLGIFILVKRGIRNEDAESGMQTQDQSEADQSAIPRKPASVAANWTEKGGVVIVTIPPDEPHGSTDNSSADRSETCTAVRDFAAFLLSLFNMVKNKF